MGFFATPYTIHFDDTMAYQSHHFLTSFKFQCAARESLLYGDLIFDLPGVPESLDAVHLFTADAYSRNLKPAFLGDRLVVLLSLEEWGVVSARFCYRVLNQRGEAICAGFQTHVCADPKSGQPTPLPDPLRNAFDQIREISEPLGPRSFRDQVLAGREQTAQLFTPQVRESAVQYLQDRYPTPKIIFSSPSVDPNQSMACSLTITEALPASSAQQATDPQHTVRQPNEVQVAELHLNEPLHQECQKPEVWVFPGQGAFDAKLLCQRISLCTRSDPQWHRQMVDCAAVLQERLCHEEGDAAAFLSGIPERCRLEVQRIPDFSQVGIFLQSVLGAHLRSQKVQPAILMGHSLGEIAALTVAGSLSLLDGVRAICERIHAVRELGPRDGKLVAILSDRSTVSEEIAVAGLSDVVVAGRNHNRQTIVSGPADQLSILCDRMRALQIATIDIPSPTSFHHPVLKPAAQAWRQQLQQLSFSSPTITVYSPIGRRTIGSQDDIATLLSSQLVRPFDLQGAIDDLGLAGFTQLVDCGSSGFLARLLRDIAPIGMQVIHDEQLEFRAKDYGSPVRDLRLADGAGSAKMRPPIAMVGQGCLLPGGASSPERLHVALMQGRSGIVDLRETDPHWERDFYAPTLLADKSMSALAGIVNECDIVAPTNVDPEFFETLSRAQKLLCIAIAPCLHLIRREDRILCLVGATADGFQDQDRVAALRYAGIDSTHPRVASRLGEQAAAWQDPYTSIRQVLDRLIHTDVPVRLIDAACASSLYSVALGMAALENNEVDIVLAGGVYCPGPGNNCLFSQFGGLTATGCRPFDAAADGVVFSEGAAIVALRRRSDAQRLGQSALAIVRGVGLSSDGRSPSANVPQSSGQLMAVRRCYGNYDLSPGSISAIEGHGTSTPAGDSTEVQTLSSYFSGKVAAPLPLHSLKGLLGHTGWAAGTAAMIAVSQMFQSRTFPAQATFSNPSLALTKSRDVLFVPTRPLRLPGNGCRIAIDGFGFGGANAHLVLEAVDASQPETLNMATPALELSDQPNPWEDLVVVAQCEVDPLSLGHSESEPKTADQKFRFNRQAVPLPAGAIVLPDLADDMDITQRLTLHLTSQTLAQLPDFSDELRSQTSLVLALEGKTERAAEATLRVLGTRFLKEWEGLPESQVIQQAYLQARPSGPYTLQCMMPNVAAGRAALHFNLNGPNFVVDAGADSLQAAISSAGWLLHSGAAGGTKLAIVATMFANRWLASCSTNSEREKEFAAAYAITTRQLASESGWPVVCSVDQIVRRPQFEGFSAFKSSDNLKSSISSDSAMSQFDLHVPDWVESPFNSNACSRQKSASERCLMLVHAEDSLADDLLEVLQRFHPNHQVLLVGPLAQSLARRLGQPHIQALEIADETSVQALTLLLDQFLPDLVLAMARPTTWETAATIRQLTDHSLCEALFVAVRHLAPAVNAGKTEVWGLFPAAWDGLIHPITGPLVGMIKSIKREMPMGRMGVISRRSESVAKVLQSLAFERSLDSNDEPEIVYDSERRLVRRLRQLPDGGLPPTEATSRLELNSNSVVLATGGARGVTSVMAETLLRDYGCTVVAWGRSPMQQGPDDPNSPVAEREFYARFVAEHPGTSPALMKQSFQRAQASWETFERISQLSRLPGRAHYMQVDVGDSDAVDRAMATLQASFGRLDLIVHGAGMQFSKRLQDRKLIEFRQTLDAKLGGLTNLMTACQSHFGKLVPVHALTSAYSIFGNDGQHDYGAANETLDRLCELISSRGDSWWTSLAWSAWAGIGMTRGSEYQALAVQRQLALMHPPEGSQIFRRVISGDTQASINVPVSQAERLRYRIRTLPANPRSLPRRSIELAIQLSEMDYLEHHKTGGIPTLPGAWIVEHMVRAVLRLANQPVRYVTVENIRFRRFVRSMHFQDRSFRVVVDSTPGGFSAWLLGDIVSSTGILLASDQVFASAILSIDQPESVGQQSLAAALDPSDEDCQAVSDPYCNGALSVQLSGPFDCLPQILVGPKRRSATFSPRIEHSWHDVVPSLLLDASIRVAGMHVVRNALHVPTGIRRMVLPVGVSSQSLENVNWTIRASNPLVEGNVIHCGRVEVTDDLGSIRMLIEDAVVTKLR